MWEWNVSNVEVTELEYGYCHGMGYMHVHICSHEMLHPTLNYCKWAHLQYQIPNTDHKHYKQQKLGRKLGPDFTTLLLSSSPSLLCEL